MDDFWQKQDPKHPLFTDAIWSKPERRDQAGRLAIIGGSSSGFAAVAVAFQTALKTGIGDLRIIMPDSLKRKIPAAITNQMTGLTWAPSNPSGGFAMPAKRYIEAAAEWSGQVLFIGDSGANSETAQLISGFIIDKDYQDTKITIARDAVDLLVYDAESILNRKGCHLIVSLAQFQKLARAVYYPRMITFSQGIKQMAETLHKFTITYPVTITLFHDGNLFVANSGQVASQPFDSPMRVWNGDIPTREAVWLVWQSDPVMAIASSWVSK